VGLRRWKVYVADSAFAHYSKAAIAGHPHGCYNLARCFHDGFGIDRDDNVALVWFEHAADQDHTLAQLSTAIAYEHGLGTPIYYHTSLKYYTMAMENGSCV
jgi:uncharacterized protein